MNFECVRSNLKVNMCDASLINGIQIIDLMSNLDCYQKVLLILKGLVTPFDCMARTLINWSLFSAVNKI